eukprot:CAMPEP_0180521614 /NCGR_PEP_ID=MMETSP1036_2-20121128/56924_1 /TAXON_ID=632150 /ORGANISM="Azadinium spinosum, Strain 3D9" /LENGTH=61 /DNA_ID=CAMNT_0022534249 /DNA_START=150 /DNA_END=331 /DNA_ORIENTATION=-
MSSIFLFGPFRDASATFMVPEPKATSESSPSIASCASLSVSKVMKAKLSRAECLMQTCTTR